MKAMILAAGLGTRLRPITDTMPKALVEVKGEAMLARVIHRLKDVGAESIIVNAYHFVDQIEAYLDNNDFGISIRVVREERPVETAGGIARARELLRDQRSVLIHNVDIISDIDLSSFYAFHEHERSFATVAVRKPANTRPFLIDRQGRIVGHRNKLLGTETLIKDAADFEEYNFCGVHVLSQEFLDKLLMRETAGISITKIYLDMIQEGLVIKAFDVGNVQWFDIGTVEKLKKAEEVIAIT